MSGSTRSGSMGLLFSAPTLTPVVLGVGAGLLLGLSSDRHRSLAAFVAVVGVLGGLGTWLTLLLSGKRLDPDVARKRREMLACLDELADARQFPPSAESDRVAAPAQAERP